MSMASIHLLSLYAETNGSIIYHVCLCSCLLKNKIKSRPGPMQHYSPLFHNAISYKSYWQKSISILASHHGLATSPISHPGASQIAYQALTC